MINLLWLKKISVALRQYFTLFIPTIGKLFNAFLYLSQLKCCHISWDDNNMFINLLDIKRDEAGCTCKTNPWMFIDPVALTSSMVHKCLASGMTSGSSLNLTFTSLTQSPQSESLMHHRSLGRIPCCCSLPLYP